MKPFSHLFRKPPPPTAPTAEQRIAALQAAPAEVVSATALGNEDATLRLAATRLLPDGEVLRRLAGCADATPGDVAPVSSAMRHAAHERLAELVDQGAIDFAALARGRERNPDTIAVAALCNDAVHLRQAMTGIDDPAQLAQLAVDAPSSRVRQAAASAIDDPSVLRELLPRLRGKDKSVYKLIREKCDALLAEQRRKDDAVREAEDACVALERHSTRTHDARYSATLEMLMARWSALSPRPQAEVEQRGADAIERCREVIAAHEHSVQEQAAAQAAATAAEREAREARERALEAERQAAAERAEDEKRALDEAVAARKAEEHARNEQRAAERQALREIEGLIRLSWATLQAGNTRKAARFRQAIDDTLPTAGHVPGHVTRNLQQLDEQLNALRQWKDYVAAPKRSELIEEMEALVGVQEEPADLADHIRALLQEWRTIHKGIADDATADDERFQRAYQLAWKPCQDYLNAQAAIRRQNLEARLRVIERLKAFEATQSIEQPDYGLISQVLREAPQEWRSHVPIDRDANRPIEIEFHQAMDRLRAIVNAWFERNAADKRKLIAQAQQLTGLENIDEAIDGVKRLQAQWKETGPVSREQSQALWDEFRAQCDALFQRREQARAQFSAGLEAAKAQAVALCEQVEQACSEAASERSAAHAKAREWIATFEALGELPRAEARALRHRFERAVSKYEAAVAQQDLRDAESAESNLFQALRLVRAYERAVSQSAVAEERESLKAAADTFIAGVHRWPKPWLQALKQALTRAEAATDADDTGREEALRMFCIRCEILSSTPSPPEEEELRREYQVRLLMERMGQANAADEQEWDDALLEWIGLGAAAPEVHDEFERRFARCLAKKPSKTSQVRSSRMVR